MMIVWRWGAVPDYLILVSVIVGVIGLRWQRKVDRQKGQEERNRQAQLEDLRIGWHAVAPLHALPGGLDDNNLAAPFAHALRQLQLSGSENVLEEVDTVISTLDAQTAARESNSIDLRAVLETIRDEYRRLMAVEPTSRPFLPLHIMSTVAAGELGIGRLAPAPELPETIPPESSP